MKESDSDSGLRSIFRMTLAWLSLLMFPVDGFDAASNY